MFDVTPSVIAPSSFDLPDLRRFRTRLKGAAPITTAPARAAISPGRVARWARGEGIRPGDAVAVMTRDHDLAASLCTGLAGIGAEPVRVATHLRGEMLAAALSGAVLAIVDTALAESYAGLMGRLDAYPAIWWNGPGADFARLDLALAEQDDLPAA